MASRNRNKKNIKDNYRDNNHNKPKIPETDHPTNYKKR